MCFGSLQVLDTSIVKVTQMLGKGAIADKSERWYKIQIPSINHHSAQTLVSI